jgi:hypothetical protein
MKICNNFCLQKTYILYTFAQICVIFGSTTPLPSPEVTTSRRRIKNSTQEKSSATPLPSSELTSRRFENTSSVTPGGLENFSPWPGQLFLN